MKGMSEQWPMPDGAVAPFDDQPGMWLRCALHAHTTESDGWLSPKMLRRYHAIKGYDVLAITDHDRFTSAPEGDDDLLLLGGVELSLKAPSSGGPLDVLGLGVTELPQVSRTAALPEAARAIRAAGGLAFVAHPVWSGLQTEELDDFDDVAGMEIFNAGCEVEQGRGHAHAHWDVWLSKGRRLVGIATDDLHTPGFESFFAWTMVHAREKSGDAVLDALRTGRCYATAGPRITALGGDGHRLTIRTTPVRSIAFLAQPPMGTALNAGRLEPSHYARRLPTADGQTVEGQIDGDFLTGATVAWLPGLRYLRIVITDEQGRTAWTNPLWPDAVSGE